MEQEQRSAAPSGRRELDLEAHIKAVEKAARDWGVNVDELEGKFVSALLAAIAASGRANIATVGDLEKLFEGARAAGEVELRRLRILLDGGEQVLRVAEEGARAAIATADKTQADYDRSVSKLAKEMAAKLLAETQKWLVLKQTNRNRRDAWRLATLVGAAALGLFVGGYVARANQEGYAMEVVARCMAAPLWVTVDRSDQAVPACRLDGLGASKPASSPSN